jgi:hypothetical protein
MPSCSALIAVESLTLSRRSTLFRSRPASGRRFIAKASSAVTCQRPIAPGTWSSCTKGTLFAAPFDLGRLAVTGVPQPVLEDVSSGTSGGWNFDFSPSGTFVYVSWKEFFPNSISIFWLDRSGKTQPLHSPPGFYRSLIFSPDSKRLALG